MLCCSLVALLALILCEVLFLCKKQGSSLWQQTRVSRREKKKNQAKRFEHEREILGTKPAGNLCGLFGTVPKESFKVKKSK